MKAITDHATRRITKEGPMPLCHIADSYVMIGGKLPRHFCNPATHPHHQVREVLKADSRFAHDPVADSFSLAPVALA